MSIPNVKFNHCVVTIITDGMGKMLFIKRKDGPWSLCAGHIEAGETPESAVRREIYEETGLTPEYLSVIHKHDNPSVFFFSAQCSGIPHGRNDPDNEGKPQWIDVTRGIPSNIYDNISGPKDDSNILKQLFKRTGLKKSEFEWSEELGFLDLTKAV
jgi:ADP-ribose pyrophosphatase YjhB (NUDIX family)